MDPKAILLGTALSLPCAALAQRVDGTLECRFTGTDFVYDCVVRLKRGAAPLAGAQLSVGADMPTMPMAHNVAPARATPGAAPGEYRVRLDLEMTGEWAVKLRLAAPLRDLIVLHYEFDEQGARPASRAPRK